MYSAVGAKRSDAKVVVTGYPLLFNGTDCNVLTFFTGDEMARLNEATAKLNAVIKARSRPPASPSCGRARLHRACLV